MYSDNLIVITGASRGIGKYLFNWFTCEGDNVVGIFKTTMPDSNVKFMHKVDITIPGQIYTFIEKIKPDLRNVILINCASINYNCFAHKANIQKWIQVLNVNLVGTFNMINAFLPYMREQNYGRIINLSSVVAQIGIPGTSAYAASKSGLWGLTKAISMENASKGITINNLNLGYFQIGMIDEVPLELQNQIKSKIPSGKFGDPQDILTAIKYLIDSPYVTGANIDINGGLL